ncbi:hypothetical protein B484DRAFT_458322 [Ochromonadaceae sp. CCMP2298]|nr:hypothetical protein B484DRAFT_458322 [Ochromonadaceae sp. CCMP2298]
MAWSAVDFDHEKREQMMGLFKVSGIPRLCVLAPSGRIIVDNAVGGQLTISQVDQWIHKGDTMG